MAPPRIELRLYASLRKWREKPDDSCALARPCSVRDFLKEAGIPEGEVAIIILNGRRALPDSPLSDGDVLRLFPLIGGG